MPITREENKAIQERFRARMRKDRVTIPIGKIMPDVFDEGLEWYAKPVTGTESDKILAHLNENKLFAAQCELLYWRLFETEELKTRVFTASIREDLARYDPKDIAEIVALLGGFEDISPSLEDAEKNSLQIQGSE